ncbi:hypothetical protein A2U01_0053407, partial [Trifolium medium]|nr:hypothetical protein [Trifolium medium]
MEEGKGEQRSSRGKKTLTIIGRRSFLCKAT